MDLYSHLINKTVDPNGENVTLFPAKVIELVSEAVKPQDNVAEEMQQLQLSLTAISGAGDAPKLLNIETQSEVSNWEEISAVLLKNIKQEYCEQILAITSQKYVSPTYLFKIHCKLLDVYTAVAKKVVKKENQNDFYLDKIAEHITVNLNLEFRSFQSANRLKLAALHKVVDGLIMDQKKVYCSQMEEILKHTNKLQNLNEKHDQIVEDIKITLKIEIAKKIGESQSCHRYFQTLNAHIEKYWVNYQKAYYSELKQQKDEFHHVSHSLKPENGNSSTTQRVSAKQFILFHISLSQVETWTFVGNSIQKIGSNLTTGCLNLDGKLQLCDNGNIANAIQQGLKVMNIGDYIKGTHSNLPIPSVWVNNRSYVVTTELLLGFVFSELKLKVEKQYKTQFMGAIIIVPFWFTSYQRQQVVDGVKMAGFTEMELINENLAIAIYAVSQQADYELEDVFVVSENSGKVDATIYRVSSLNERGKTLKLTGHCGNYEVSSNSKQDMVTDACIEAQSQSQHAIRDGKMMTRPLKLYLSSESPKWKQKLAGVRNNLLNHNFGSEECWKDGIAVSGSCIYIKNVRHYQISPLDLISSNIYYDVISSNGHQSKIKCLSNSDKTIFENEEIVVTLPERTKEAKFYQQPKYCQKQMLIGKLTVNGDYRNIPVKMYIDHNGIVSFVERNDEKSANCFSWMSANFNEYQIKECTSILRDLNPNLKSRPVSNSKEELIEKLNKLDVRIKNGEGNFRSDIGKEMAANQIQNSVKALRNSAHTLTIDSQQAIYDTISKKYF